MKIALIDQLLDCYIKPNPNELNIFDIIHAFHPRTNLPADPLLDKLNLACINGRVGRIISALSLLDNDPILNSPEIDEKEIANIAYMKASSILKEELKTENMENIYTKDVDQLTNEERENLNKFEKNVKDKIENTLLKEYKDIISNDQLTNIIKKSQLGV